MERMDGNLIFLITLPRSGSTLLQHVLGNHPDIITLPEPWLMLHLVYALKQEQLQAPYNARLSGRALQEFLGYLPGGRDTYIEGIRSMANHLYGRVMEGVNKKYFLDKATRYYSILPELFEIFPDAKYVFLIRNPLAVFSSVLKTSLGDDFQGLFRLDRKSDLLEGPRAILEGINRLGDNAHVVHYEQLVSETDTVLEELCGHLGVVFHRGMASYGDKVQFAGSGFVDPKSIYRHQAPITDYIDRWPSRLDSAQNQHLGLEYLRALGKDTVQSLGYSYDELQNTLEKIKKKHILPLARWSLLVKDSQDRSWFEGLWILFCTKLQVSLKYYRRYGAGHTLVRIMKGFRGGASA